MKKLIIATAISASLVIPATALFSENIAIAATSGTKTVQPVTSVVAPVTPALAGELTTTPMKVVKVSAKKVATKKVAVKKAVAKKAVAKKAVAKKRIRKSALRK
jgi:hypothetical protein